MRDSHSPGRETEHKKHKRRKLRIVVLLVFLFLFLMACRRNKSNDPEPGVPLSLATQRAESIGALSYDLSFTVPKNWQSRANRAETFHEDTEDHTRIRYGETQPIPTYLFAFAAGKFQMETAEINGRWYRMFHRETDAKKVERNKQAVFALHA